jgi:hypothetical protein
MDDCECLLIIPLCFLHSLPLGWSQCCFIYRLLKAFFQSFPTYLEKLAKFSHEYTKFHNCPLSNEDIEVRSLYWSCQTIKTSSDTICWKKIGVAGVYGQQDKKDTKLRTRRRFERKAILLRVFFCVFLFTHIELCF